MDKNMWCFLSSMATAILVVLIFFLVMRDYIKLQKDEWICKEMGVRMVLVPAGKILMKKEREVCISYYRP